MTIIDVNDFAREIECIYDEERYSVRDNGAVLRHQQIGKRIRRNDNKWTFGKVNSLNPYLHISNVRIHRIVATAFHGEPPDPLYVVDHIDSNCRNNRPENLRWVTRLENALINPVTRKKIELLCGIEAFLENPSILNTLQVSDPSFAWMRTVTLEEAQNCKEHMSIWANTGKKPKGGSLGEWVYEPIKKKEKFDKKPGEDFLEKYVYKPIIKEEEIFSRRSELVMALTKRCAQHKWRVPSYFPCCPEEIGVNPLEEYFQNLKVGAVFSYNNVYPKSMLLEFVKITNNASILVMCEIGDEIDCVIKPWAITEITFKNGLFIHSNLGSFFSKDGADKVFCIEQGLEWTGGDTFDDFC